MSQLGAWWGQKSPGYINKCWLQVFQMCVFKHCSSAAWSCPWLLAVALVMPAVGFMLEHVPHPGPKASPQPSEVFSNLMNLWWNWEAKSLLSEFEAPGAWVCSMGWPGMWVEGRHLSWLLFTMICKALPSVNNWGGSTETAGTQPPLPAPCPWYSGTKQPVEFLSYCISLKKMELRIMHETVFALHYSFIHNKPRKGFQMPTFGINVV